MKIRSVEELRAEDWDYEDEVVAEVVQQAALVPQLVEKLTTIKRTIDRSDIEGEGVCRCALREALELVGVKL